MDTTANPDDQIPTSDLPTVGQQPDTQGADPVTAELGDDGQGDIAPEDLQNPIDTAERPEFTDDDNLASPQDLRVSLPVDEIAESGIEG